MPPGVVNVLLGGPDVGQALAGSPGIDHLSFVGSTATGADVIARSARNIVPVKIELGGKSPSVVLDDADLASTAATVGTRRHRQRRAELQRDVAGDRPPGDRRPIWSTRCVRSSAP